MDLRVLEQQTTISEVTLNSWLRKGIPDIKSTLKPVILK